MKPLDVCLGKEGGETILPNVGEANQAWQRLRTTTAHAHWAPCLLAYQNDINLLGAVKILISACLRTGGCERPRRVDTVARDHVSARNRFSVDITIRTKPPPYDTTAVFLW